MDCINELELLIKSRYPIVYFEAKEEERIDAIIAAVAKKMGIFFYTWTVTEGLKAQNSQDPYIDTQSPLKALNSIGVCGAKVIYVLKDFHKYLNDPVVLRKMKDVAKIFATTGSTMIIIASDNKIPDELRNITAHLTLELPGEDEIRETVRKTIAEFSHLPDMKDGVPEEMIGRIALNVKGLTLFEIERALNRVLLRDGKLCEGNFAELVKAKKEIVEKDGLLEYYVTDAALTSIGGMEHLKKWLEKRKCIFTQPETVASYGLEPPKGILVTGIQGCGKSLFAKTVSREWGIPLLKLDAGALYNKYIGESESNLRKALSVAESIAPVILWVDEIEKGFSYSAQGDGDSGTSKRLFATFLTWLQEKKAGIFIVATSNDISQLPPELVRKGRFDEIFFVDLPDARSREEIFGIHLRKRKFDPAGFDLAKLVAASEGFSGAEIEQAVISALYGAFSLKKNLTSDLVLEEIANTRPLSVTMKEKIDCLREWASERASRA